MESNKYPYEEKHGDNVWIWDEEGKGHWKNVSLYKQIEKEFDECEHLETGMCDMNVAKSFLKQSFITFLENECERQKENLEAIADIDNDFARGMRHEMQSQINTYQNTIKELQA